MRSKGKYDPWLKLLRDFKEAHIKIYLFIAFVAIKHVNKDCADKSP